MSSAVFSPRHDKDRIEAMVRRAFWLAKELVLNLGAALEYVFHFSRRFDDRSNAVLMYHSVGGHDDLPGNLPVDRFRRDLEFLTTTYDVVDLPGVLETGTTKRIAITFDDGYRNFFTDALPLLRAYDVPATVFVSPGSIDHASLSQFSSSPDSAEQQSIPMMTASQIRACIDDELITIGNHTRTHPDLTTIADTDDLSDEIAGAKAMLEDRFDITVNRFAYPHGPFDETCEAIVRESHELAVTGVPRLVPENIDRYRIPRIPADTVEPRIRWQLTDLHERLDTWLTTSGRSIQQLLFE